MPFGLSEVGGIVGLLGGLVVLFDRYYKGRPVASLTVDTLSPSGRKLVCVRIQNTTPYDVVIRHPTNRQRIYYLTQDEEPGTLLQGAAGTLKFAFMLKPDETKKLIIKAYIKDNVPLEVKKPGYVEFLIPWRRGNATWLPQIPILVCSTTQIVRELGGVE
jgi:hypothetical protein